MSQSRRPRKTMAQSNQQQRFGRRRDLCSRTLVYESLEDRRMLSGYFDDIRDLVAAPGAGSAMGAITQGLRAVDSLTRLPLINKPIKEIGQLTGALESFRDELYSALNSLDPSSTVPQIQSAIFNVLGPSGAKVLANKVAPDSVGQEDVVVTPDGGGVDISIDIGFTSEQFNSELGLGIDAVPFRPQDDTDGGFSVGLTYRNFNFGYNTTELAYFRTAALNELQLKLNGFLPSTFTAGLGFLNFQVTDATPGTNPEDADLALTLTSDVDSNFDVSVPKIGGSLDLLANLEVQVSGEGMPKVRTDLRLNWAVPDVLANTPLGGAWGSPTLRFENVSLQLGSLLGDIVRPIASDVKDIIEPLDPLFNLLQKRIPALSDLSEAVGGPTINLLSLSTALSQLPNPPSQLINMIESADRLRVLSNTVDTLAGLAGGGWINVGSFGISGPSGSSLLDTASAALGNLGLDDWSSLVSADGGINFEGLKQQIRNLLGDELGNDINGIWDALSGEWEGNGLTVEFPIVDDPGGVALGMLLGKDKDLVTVTGNLHQELDESFDIKIIPGFFIEVTAKANFHAKAGIGFDTRGLRDAIAPLYAGNNFDASKLLNGLYIDHETYVTADGTIGLGAKFGFPDVATFTVGGGLTGELHANISNPHDPPLEKIRPFAGDLGDRLFNVGGKLEATASARLKAGVDAPIVGFVGIDKSWTFASATLFEFTTDHVPLPASLVPPPPVEVKLYTYDAATKTLTLNVGQGVVDESFVVKRLYRSLLRNTGEGPFDLIQTVAVDSYQISAFGVTQTVVGEFDKVVADFGGGRDNLKVEDASSSTNYEIYMGDGDDVVDIDGRLDALIYGGDGADTIDGGSGRSVVVVDGGKGTDSITFGGGRLEDVDPDAVFIVSKEPNGDDSSTDLLTIDNSQSTADTKYFFQAVTAEDIALVVESNDGTGLIRPTFVLEGVQLDLFSGRGNDQFLGTAPVYARLYGGDGDDLLDLNYNSPGQLPVTSFPLGLIGFSTFFGGAGHDTVLADDTATGSSRSYTLDAVPTSSASSAMIWQEDADTLYALLVGGIEDTQLKVKSTRAVRVNAWADGDLKIEAGEVQLAADSYMLWDSTVIVRNTPNIKLFDAHPATSFSTAGIDANGPYVELPPPHQNTVVFPRIRIDLDTVAANFSFQVDQATFSLSPELLARPWDISFAGSTDTIVEIRSPAYAVANVPAPDYSYRLDADRIEIGPLTLPLSGIAQLIVNSGQGNDRFQIDENPVGTIATFRGGFGDDNFVVGDGHVGFIPAWNIDGGDGTDTLTFDDSLSTFDTTWEVKPDLVTFFGGIFSVGTGGLETISLLGGSGNDEVRFSGNTLQGVNLNTGAGNDTIIAGYTGITSFRAPLTINAAAGNDAFVWNGVNNGFNDDALTPITYPAVLDGGSGFNTLAVNDQERGDFGAFPDYDIYPDRFRVEEFGITSWADFNYDNMSGITLTCSDNSDRVDVFGTSADLDVGNQFTILGNGGADDFLIYPHDAVGNLSINGNLGIGGGASSDRVVVEDTASSLPINYRVHNQFGVSTTNIGGLGNALVGAGSDVERIDIRGGSGPDWFHVAPQPATTIMIAAGAPTSVPGDRLNLDLAQTQNSVIQNTGVGVGHVTSSNRQPIFWTGIEQQGSGDPGTNAFSVTNVLDSGIGSLRQAILDANASSNVDGPDVIRFAIPGAGPQFIQPLSALPQITDPVLVDATTQPGFSGTPIIEIDGSLVPGAVGLDVRGGNSTIRGLAVNRFSTGVLLAIQGNNALEGNYIGVGTDGSTAKGSAAYGVAVGFGSGANRIGTNGDGVNDAREPNVISGSTTANILIQGTNSNIIAGNSIGTNAAGSAAIGNAFFGVWLSSAASDNRIGTNADGAGDAMERNLIAGNQVGVFLDGSGADSAVVHTIIAGNSIGANAAGVSGVGNTSTGILIQASNNNTIGGSTPAAANAIVGNQSHGVQILSGKGNSISHNSIFGNAALGIDLAAPGDSASGVTPNDAFDADTGANTLQNFPQVTNALATSTHTVVSGRLQSEPNTSFRIEFFASPTADASGHGEGTTYLGSVSALSDSAGSASFVGSFSTVVPTGQFVTATATDPLGNTSEFSIGVPVLAGSTQPNIVSLPHPTATGLINVTSPPGTTLTASITSDPTVTPPSGVAFPFGFIDFTVRGLAPGSSASVTIAGLDVTEITNYARYGATPATATDHWYSFLFGQQTDGDSAVGTGMQIVGGNIVLRFIDGGRGDDDLAANGVIVDIGGPVRNKRPDAKDLTAAVTEDGKAEVKLLATDVETPAVALIFTVTSLPTQGQLSTQSGAAVHVGDQFTGAPTLAYEPGAARDGAGNDSFDYIVTDSTGVAGALSDNANVAVTINKAVADGKVTVDSNGIVRVGGTSGNDNIVATRSGSKLLVKINGKTVSSNTALSNVKEIRAWGRGGNDKISVLLVDVPTLLHGGTGNDEIIGALGSNLIFGGSGNDKLLGGVRNDLLVGGAGTDTIIDALGDDVLVGGEVTNQLTDDFYRQVLQQWDNGQNQNNRFKQSLTNDGAIDSLFDSLGDDWFVVGNGDLKVDLNPFDDDLVTSV